MIIADRYVYEPTSDRLGKGGFGSVFKAFDQQTQRTVALKFVPQSKLPTRYSLTEETQRLKSLAHPNLVKYYDVILKDFENMAGEKDSMQIGVMEYVNGGDLGAYMKMPFARQALKIKSLLIGILEGLAYLHSHKIIHRDIKPQNILLAIEGQTMAPKIADFSLSKRLSNELTSVSAAVGTYEYMSPEQLGRGDSKVGITTDIWAFGVLMYQLLTQKLPFGSRRKGDTDGQIVANIIDTQFVPDFSEIDPEYQAIVKKCLEKNPSQRFQNADEILALLRPPHSVVQNNALTFTLPEINSFFNEIKEETEEDLPKKIEEDPLQTIYQPNTHPPSAIDELPTLLPPKETIRFQHEVTQASDVPPSFASKNEGEKTINSEEHLHKQKEIYDETLLDQAPSSAPEKEQHSHIQDLPQNLSDFEKENPQKQPNYAPFFAVFVMLLLALLGWAGAKGYLSYKNTQAQHTPNKEDSLAISLNDTDTLKNTNTATTVNENQTTHNTINNKTNSTNTNTQPEPTTSTNTNQSENSSTSTTTNPSKEEKPTTSPTPNTQTTNIRYDYEEEGRLGKIVSKNGLYGFIDKSGVVLVPLQYQDFAYPQEGLAAVKQGNKWGFINLQNQVVIPFRYDRPGVFRNGRAQVSIGNRDFYIDKNGNPMN